MIAFVTILFGVSWLPIHCLHIAMKFFPNSFPFYSDKLYTFKNMAHTLTFMNSMLNPFFYTMMGNNFRKQIFARKPKYSTRFKAYYTRAGSGLTANSQNKTCIISATTAQRNRASSSHTNIILHSQQASRKSSASNNYSFINHHHNNNQKELLTYKF
jgi:hypothetical protein